MSQLGSKMARFAKSPKTGTEGDRPVPSGLWPLAVAPIYPTPE